MTDLTDRVYIRLNGSAPDISPIDIVKKIWWFNDGYWAPQGFSSHGNSYFTLTEQNDTPPTEPNINLFEITSQGTSEPHEPLLVTDRGFVVKKDIAAGGYVSANQGELWLGSGRDDQLDVPKIVLFQSETSRVSGGGPLSIDGIPEGATFPTKVNGKLFKLTIQNGEYAAGTIYRCYGDEPNGQWVAKGHYTEFPGNFDTLYIRKYDDEGHLDQPAHLDLGDLLAHGYVYVNDLSPVPEQEWIDVHSKLRINGDLQLVDGKVASSLNPVTAGFGLGSPTEPWTGVACTTVYTDNIKDLEGEDWDFPWNGGTVTNDISIEKSTPILFLKSSSGNPYLKFGSDAETKVQFVYSIAGAYLVLQKVTGGTADILKITNAGQLTVYGDIMPSGTVDLGSGVNAFDNIYGAHGYIGELTVTQDIYADTIYGLTDGDLTIEPYSGNRIYINSRLKVNGDLQFVNRHYHIEMNTGYHGGFYDATAGSYLLEFILDESPTRVVSNLPLYFYNNSAFIGFRSGASRLYSNADGVIQVQDSGGSLGTLDTGNLYVDHIVAASGGAVTFLSSPIVVDEGNNSIRFGESGLLESRQSYYTALAQNAYYTSGWKHISNDEVGVLEFNNGQLVFYTGGAGAADSSVSLTELMRIYTSGNMKLAGSLYLTGNTSGSYLWNNGGWIRVGHSSYGLIVDGWISVGNLSSGSTNICIDGSNRLSCQSSSERYKENIDTLEDCSWIYDVRPVNFDWKDKERAEREGRQFGLIAEEVAKIYEGLTFSVNDRIEGVHFHMLAVPMLVEMKKLRTRVGQLEKQLGQSEVKAA